MLCCDSYLQIICLSLYTLYCVFHLIDYLNIKHTGDQNIPLFNMFRGGSNIDFAAPNREQNYLNIINNYIIIIIWVLFLLVMLNSKNEILKYLSIILIIINFFISKKIVNNCNNWKQTSIHLVNNYKMFSNSVLVLLVVFYISSSP